MKVSVFAEGVPLVPLGVTVGLMILPLETELLAEMPSLVVEELGGGSGV